MDNTTVVIPLKKSEFCSRPNCGTYTRYGISINNGPFEMLCRKHRQPFLIQEYWIRRMLLASQDGREEDARGLLDQVLSEVRHEEREACAKIADVHAEDALTSYSDHKVGISKSGEAKQIARSIRMRDN